MKFNNLAIGCFVIAMSSGSFAFGADTIIHPKPTKPFYLSESLYPKFKTEISLPPEPGSVGQRRDEEELVKAQAARTLEQCKEAESVVRVNLKNFYGAPHGGLTDKEVAKLEGLFRQIGNDADFFIQKLKVEFPRKRPFEYVTGLSPCVLKEVTGAYPSGHAALSSLFSLILSDLYPRRAAIFKERAKTIAQTRILSGMHHPTDIQAGKELGSKLYQEFKKNPKFTEDLKDVSSLK